MAKVQCYHVHTCRPCAEMQTQGDQLAAETRRHQDHPIPCPLLQVWCEGVHWGGESAYRNLNSAGTLGGLLSDAGLQFMQLPSCL